MTNLNCEYGFRRSRHTWGQRLNIVPAVENCARKLGFAGERKGCARTRDHRIPRLLPTSLSPASVLLAKNYLERISASENGNSRAALRWLVRAWRGWPSQDAGLPRSGTFSEAAADAGRHVVLNECGVPPPAREDLGQTDWERDLIVAIRRKGFLWRTERTYRAWAARFAAHLQPRSPYAAEGADIAEFLSKLVVQQRVSASTQKQALNALVFFLQEALRRSPGEFDFRRARGRQRMPVVLSKTECQRLFEQLPGTSRMMGELMYGAGLRLMEMLRLRVHHIDLERGQVRVYGGKD